jgi:hypothetical protein
MLAAVLVATVLVGVFAPSASADHCNDASSDGRLDYCNHGEDEQDENNNRGPAGEAPCDLSVIDADSRHEWDNLRWCQGQVACYAHVPAELQPTEAEQEEKPSDDAEYIYWRCLNPDGSDADAGFDWREPDGPSTEELAWEAYGNLSTPSFDLKFSPRERSYVDIATWWWVDGPSTGEIVGSSAAGLVAIGTPSRMEVDVGDGSPTLTCPWVTRESDECQYTYVKASVGGPETSPDGPAYLAQARLVFDVRFELDGSPIDVPGLPDTLESPWRQAVVPVAEIQALVDR